MNTTHAIRLVLPALALAAAGCSSENPSQPSQVVATVNDSEITISQLRATLFARGEVEPTVAVTQQTLEGLVNEQLLVDAALEAGMDRDPTVVQALETARRQILANAYAERSIYQRDPISADEQTAYFRENPALFAERRIYQISEFACDAESLPETVLTGLEAVTTDTEVSELFSNASLVCSKRVLTRSAEQLPLPQLASFALAEPGDVLIGSGSPDGISLSLVTGIQDSPLPFDEAQPIIQQYLANVRNAEALDGFLKQARVGAQISHSEALLMAAVDPNATPEIDRPSGAETVSSRSESVLQ